MAILYRLDLSESTVDVNAIQSAFVTFNYGHQNLKHVVVIDFIIIFLDRTLQLVQLRHVIVGFQGYVKASNCVKAVAAKLRLNDKLYDHITKTCCHIQIYIYIYI